MSGRSTAALLLCFSSVWGAPLALETAIPMPGVRGRIDHLAIDVKRQRLFVAALGSNSLEIIDLKRKSVVGSIRGLAEPQGVAYAAVTNRVFVANGGDGSVRAYDGSSGKPIMSIPYGDDADNLRVDPDGVNLWAGYGSGGLGEFDPNGKKLAEIKLDAHPESFQLEKDGPRIFVNLPGSRKIAVVDRKTRSFAGTWSTGNALENFPMALDESDRRLFVVTRRPARLIAIETDGGKEVASLPAIGDCDDVFYDARRRRIYAIGGEGGISVFVQKDADHYERAADVTTVRGARTGYFSPELDRLYVAIRQTGNRPAEIRVYAPGTGL